MTRIFGSPGRYVQAAGLIDQAAQYIGKLKARRVAILCTPRSQRNEAPRLLASLHGGGIETVIATFGGECSLQEIERQTAWLREQGAIDALIALGGGKTLDAGRSIAHRLEVPVVVMPTQASNDAPCTAISVLYTPEGATESFELFDQSPALVLVDTEIIIQAPVRFVVAGIGDAISTWYEARASQQNPAGITPFYARPTLAGTALAEACGRILSQYAVEALAAAEAKTVNAAFEHIVEANILLSGLGGESGGVAAAHAVAQALTLLEVVDKHYLHGEMVAFGLLAQLMLESDIDEADKVGRLLVQVGLPVTLGQLGVDRDDVRSIDSMVEATMAFPLIGNMPFTVTADGVRQALLDADRLGQRIIAELGDRAYRRLHD